MRNKLLAIAGLALIFTWNWILTPWGDVVGLILILATAPAATVFAIGYGLTSPWWKTMIGKAMLVSSTALALLVDISLIYQWLGDDYFLRQAVKNTVFTLVCLGAWFKLMAWGIEQWRAWRQKRASTYDTA